MIRAAATWSTRSRASCAPSRRRNCSRCRRDTSFEKIRNQTHNSALVNNLDASAIETVFRREAGRLVSVLTRILGPQNLELAEDVVQEAFVAAMRDWTADGVPDNPPAWLLTTARRRAIDAIR